MKIAYDGKRFFHNASGLGNYSRDLVRILAQNFPDNYYFVLNKNKSERGESILELDNVEYVPTSKSKLARQLKLGKEAQELGVDIFHGLSGELPLKWDDKPIKKVVTIHDLIFVRYPEYYSWFDRKIHFWKFKKAAETADLIIAISEQTKKDIIEYLKVPASKIRVVYQGCHQAFKQAVSENSIQNLKYKYNLPDKFLLNVGTIEDRKNLLNVVKALIGKDIPLVVVGKKTKYFNKIEKIIRKHNVNVQFLDSVSMEELAVVYRLANAFIYPSFFEGFGIPVIEALFSKTPVITSNTSCLPEAGGEYSLYVNPHSVEDIRAKILFLWENEADCKRRAEKGFEYVQKFQDSEIAKNLMSVYQEVLG